MLYTLTPEHQEHVICEKDAYTSLTPLMQCIYLERLYNRPYDYDMKLLLVEDPVYPGFYETTIADLEKDISYGDVLKAVALLSDDINGAALYAQNVQNKENKLFIFSSSSREYKIDEKSKINISVSVKGIPMISMKYASLHIRVHCQVHPGNVVCTFRILPKNDRRMLIQMNHTIKTFQETHNGYDTSNSLRISNGLMSSIN